MVLAKAGVQILDDDSDLGPNPYLQTAVPLVRSGIVLLSASRVYFILVASTQQLLRTFKCLRTEAGREGMTRRFRSTRLSIVGA